MADNLLRHLGAGEKFLLSSTRFWSSLSTVAVTGALASFCFTQQHTNSYNDLVIYIFISVTIIFHVILFFFDPQNLKNTFAPFFHGSAKKWAIRITAMRAGYLLHYVPEQSITGLIFVICVWIDAIAIGRIVNPSLDMWIGNSVLTAIVGRSNDLYGYSGGYWVVMGFCFLVSYVQVRLDGYKKDEMKEKEG
ncbi:hypothetical protein R6Q59_028508 [Mikania micrantha]|uniref:Uncharacterized protein n=1 Tax=Mikania micrantha TaxID=192012 RepID=A0A5N6M771_9ASTR|nr:hypothetical protein E3N88_31785 [Mikania micrantha]